MDMKVENIPSYKIAYLRRVGPYGAENVATMEKLKTWARTNNLLNKNSVILGIPQDNPETTDPDSCRYDTCIVVSNNDSFVDEDVHSGHISGGKYAVFKIRHTSDAVKSAWMEIFPELSARAYQWDETRPVLERYIPESVNNHYCEICVPLT